MAIVFGRFAQISPKLCRGITNISSIYCSFGKTIAKPVCHSLFKRVCIRNRMPRVNYLKEACDYLFINLRAKTILLRQLSVGANGCQETPRH